MPKVTITNTKGLVQSKGSGLVVQSSSTLNGAVSANGTLSNEAGVESSNWVTVNVMGPATALPASGQLLVKNTYYAEDTTSAETFLLPTIANSAVGDWIKVEDTAGLANGELITIGSAASGDFAVGCHLLGRNVLATSSTEAVDISVVTDNSVIMAGLTNGAGGAGSSVTFVFNGTAWTVTGLSLNIGNGTAATVGASAMRFAATA